MKLFNPHYQGQLFNLTHLLSYLYLQDTGKPKVGNGKSSKEGSSTDNGEEVMDDCLVYLCPIKFEYSGHLRTILEFYSQDKQIDLKIFKESLFHPSKVKLTFFL